MDWQVFTGLLAYKQTTHVASMAAFGHGRATAKTAGHRCPAICQKRHKSHQCRDLHSKQNSRHTVCVSAASVASGCQSVRPETALIVRACRDGQTCMQFDRFQAMQPAGPRRRPVSQLVEQTASDRVGQSVSDGVRCVMKHESGAGSDVHGSPWTCRSGHQSQQIV
jgi:hypothetical protein